MKRAFLSIVILLSTLVGVAQTKGDTLYVAQDDIKHFISASEDSIVCHTYDSGNFIFHTCIYRHNHVHAYTETLVMNVTRDNFYFHGPRMSFYANGKPEIVSNYIYGCLFGYYGEWYQNGQIKISGKYWLDIANDKIILNNTPNDTITTKESYGLWKQEIISSNCPPIKDGIWEYYDSNGILIKRELWDKGILK